MHIHPVTPYRTDRNLGKAYNDAFALIGEDDYLLITDYDVLYLLPDTINKCYEYVKEYPYADMFVCWGNRTYPTNAQLYRGKFNESADIREHILIAKEAAKDIPKATRIERTISGFLMLIPKRTWNRVKFVEDLKCLGVDSLFSQKLVDLDMTIYRMDGIYVWHTYRLEGGINNKKHLL